MTDTQTKNTWGGKRAGAGRKPSLIHRFPWSVKVTEAERAYLKQCLLLYRSKAVKEQPQTNQEHA